MADRTIGVGVGVILLQDGEILLGKRSETTASHAIEGKGAWNLPGGSMEFKESFEQAARRETREETGIEINDVRVICVNNDVKGNMHFITIGMLSRNFHGTAKVQEPETITRWEWFPLDSLPQPLYLPSEEIIKSYRTDRFYLQGEGDPG